MGMGKTYYIRKVEGGGVKRNSEKKKTSVGLFSTFRHPLVVSRKERDARFLPTNPRRNLWLLRMHKATRKKDPYEGEGERTRKMGQRSGCPTSNLNGGC